MRDPARRRGLAQTRRCDRVFDLMVFPGRPADAARLTHDNPDLASAREHAGSPTDRPAEGERRWRGGIAELARRPNVAIKISDLVAYDHDWTLDSLRAVALHAARTAHAEGSKQIAPTALLNDRFAFISKSRR